MEQLNAIGLDQLQASALAKKLDRLLADYQIFYMNVRGFHWNIKGEKFFELHLKFEEIYNDLALKIDELAERILTLGFVPTHSYEQYINCADVKATTDITDPMGAVQQILNAFKVILLKQRELLKLTGEFEDEGTNALMSDYIREQEKLVWMFRAYLKN